MFVVLKLGLFMPGQFQYIKRRDGGSKVWVRNWRHELVEVAYASPVQIAFAVNRFFHSRAGALFIKEVEDKLGHHHVIKAKMWDATDPTKATGIGVNSDNVYNYLFLHSPLDNFWNAMVNFGSRNIYDDSFLYSPLGDFWHAMIDFSTGQDVASRCHALKEDFFHYFAGDMDKSLPSCKLVSIFMGETSLVAESESLEAYARYVANGGRHAARPEEESKPLGTLKDTMCTAVTALDISRCSYA
jgi:hypothetical protein